MHNVIDMEHLTSSEAVDDVEENGRTPLMYSAMAEREDCLKLLLKKHAHVSARDNNGQTALHWAAVSVSSTHLQIVSCMMLTLKFFLLSG